MELHGPFADCQHACDLLARRAVRAALADNPPAFVHVGRGADRDTTNTSTELSATWVRLSPAAGGEAVRTLVSDALRTQGAHRVEWDGRTDAGPLGPDGTYAYTVDATDEAGQTAPQGSGTVRVDLTGPTPVVTEPAGPVTVTSAFYTFRGTVQDANLVELLREVNRNGVRDAGDTFIHNSPLSETGTAWGIQTALQEDSTTPNIASVSASPTSFSPNGDGRAGTTNIRYTLSEAASVTVRVYNAAGTLVRTLVSSQSRNAGANTAVWDGKSDAGATVPVATYTFRVDATNTVGHAATQRSGTLRVVSQ